MSRVNDQTQSLPAASQALLAQVQQAFGATPNMFKLTANSPAALQSMWGAFAALGKGTLGAKLGELIAVAIANRNQCDYCLAAHTALGQNAGLSAADLLEAQSGRSGDAKIASALAFALQVVEGRGQVDQQRFADLRAAGFSDGQIVELLAHIALNLFTNYINIALETPVDFPRVAFK